MFWRYVPKKAIEKAVGNQQGEYSCFDELAILDKAAEHRVDYNFKSEKMEQVIKAVETVRANVLNEFFRVNNKMYLFIIYFVFDLMLFLI